MEKDKVIGKIGIIYNITENMLDMISDSYPELEKELGIIQSMPHLVKPSGSLNCQTGQLEKQQTGYC